MSDRLSPDLSADELRVLRQAFERVSAQAWGIAVGMLGAVGLFLATVVLLVKGGPNAGAHLGLLSNYFPGFDISLGGALIGAAYVLVLGFAAGWLVGTIYNAIVDRTN